MNIIDLPIERRIELIERLYDETGIAPQVLEKDWWVTMTLKALFRTSCSDFLVFKGGTSLSKGWGLIERFSEDIDLAISHDFFGIIEVSTKNQRDKLRKLSSKYVQEKLILELNEKLQNDDISGFTLEVEPTESSDKDPQVLYVRYETLFSENKYLLPWVKIEISCRSLREPFEPLKMRSIIAENFQNETFADDFFTVNTVSPKRTFLEKAFLLHEALQRGRTKSKRMTRHLYDLYKLMDTHFAQEALADTDLYKTIVAHRFVMTREKGVDYSTHSPAKINFIPENENIAIWREDYRNMQETFIYENAIGFDKLLSRMAELQNRFRAVEIDEAFFEEYNGK